MSYISVMGAGSWGTTIAKLLAEKDFDVSMWAYEEEVVNEINNAGTNSIFMPDVKLPKSIRAHTEISEAISNSRYIVNAVPTQFTRRVIESALPHIEENAVIISISKGIENGTYLTVSSIIRKLTNHAVAVLSGPSFAAEVSKRLPAAVTLATEDYSAGIHIQEIFNTDHFRVYTHHDVLGVELGGALKNVMAVAAGIAEGLQLGNNARASLITRGLAEMTRLGVTLGAKEHTFSGLSGIGDLVLTCNSTLSRNFTVGCKIGKGSKLDDILKSTRSVAEGVFTAKAAYELSKNQNVEMPIVEQVYKVLYEDKDPREAVNDLMSRTLKAEFHG
jgi:glycerol-3-phosphate dehydrogenase (NAD(P)+)